MAASSEEFRCFVGGLSWDTTDKVLEDNFRPFGNVSEAKVVVDRDTGRSRGFGFVTFQDERSMDEAIDRMHGKDLDGRSITVNKAQPKTGGGGGDRGYGGGGGGGYNGGKSYSGGGGGGGGGSGDCFKCGQPGHWARECPSSGGAGGGGGGRYSSDRYGSSRSDRYGSSGGGSYGGSRYGSGDRSERSSDRYNGGGDRYGGAGGRSSSGREGGGRGGGSSDRYSGGGPSRYEGGSHRDRSGPYDRPSATSGGSRSSYEDRY